MVGIMQGRLTIPNGRGIQFFPFENWKEEFITAAEIGLDEIEFIFDYDCYENNPLWIERGEAVKEIMSQTGIKVHSVCFDYFMRRPFYKSTEQEQKSALVENEKILDYILMTMRNLDIGLLEIPLVDHSSLKDKSEESLFRDFIKKEANKYKDIKFGLETDLPPMKFKTYLESIGETNVGANYDSGNSSGLGYDPYEEVTTLEDYIFNIHIKDRIYQGKTVALGTGSADFDKLFRGLKEIKYNGSFILQAARGEDGFEKENIMEQMKFIKGYLK